MKIKALLFSALLIVLFYSNSYGQNDDKIDIDNLYLEQKPPGMKPELFAPDIISSDNKNEGNITMNKKGDIFIYRIFDNSLLDPLKIISVELKNGEWIKLL